MKKIASILLVVVVIATTSCSQQAHFSSNHFGGKKHYTKSKPSGLHSNSVCRNAPWLHIGQQPVSAN